MVTEVPNQPKTPLRTFRIPEELYTRAQDKARTEGQALSAVVRALLSDYVDDDDNDGRE